MKASDLIKQEDFGGRLAETMSRFFSLYFGGNWSAAWNIAAAPPGSQRWLVNTFLNAVFVPGVDRGVLEVVRREFGTSVVAWKRPMQRGYFSVATSRAARLMAQASVVVGRTVPNADRWLIIPSAHKVRFIDSASNLCYCCRKSGSDPAHFQREMAARRFAEEHCVPVPRIQACLSPDCIVEHIVVGTPLNRLISFREQADGLHLALNAMDPLYDATRRIADLTGYSSEIVAEIEAMAAALPVNVSREIAELVTGLRETCPVSGASVELIRSHGDFQPGNILYDRGRVWLIDWEFSRERSRPFDRLTYELKARFTPGLAERIADYAAACADDSARRDLWLFVLETLHFECDQAIATPGAISWSLVAKLREFKRTLPALHEPAADAS